jgi:hypothetical protein
MTGVRTGRWCADLGDRPEIVVVQYRASCGGAQLV